MYIVITHYWYHNGIIVMVVLFVLFNHVTCHITNLKKKLINSICMPMF